MKTKRAKGHARKGGRGGWGERGTQGNKLPNNAATGKNRSGVVYVEVVLPQRRK